MKTKGHSAADELSREIDQWLTGSKQGEGSTGESELAREMVGLARGIAPERGFAAALEQRLLREYGRKARPAAVRRWVYGGAAFAAMAAVVLLAVVLLGGRAPLPDSGIAGVVETPTATEQAPGATPAPRPMLPSLVELANWGIGGQGGQTPEDLELELAAELPQGPGSLTVYSLLEQEQISVESARSLADMLGMAGGVYMPLWMADVAAVANQGHSSYYVIDGTRQVMLEGAEYWTYFDREDSAYQQGHFRVPLDLPGEAEAEEIARRFLEAYGLWLPSASVRLSANVVSFYAIGDGGYEVSEPYAHVVLGDGGRIESVTYRPYNVLELGEYALRSAEEAYAMISSGSGESWFASAYDPFPWGVFSGMDPQYWVRERADGAQADLFGDPFVLLPAVEGQQAYVQLTGIELQGMQDEIAEFVIGMGGPLHVWGTIEQADGYQVLHVAGWEAGQALSIPGFIRTLGGEGRLEGHDGQVYILPDLPADLADGEEVFVQGGLVGSVLEWDLIQAMPDASQPGCQGCGNPAASGVGTIESVELVYYAPPVGYVPLEAREGVDYGAIQPVWRFRGHDDRGVAFIIYVQAVVEVGE